MFDTDIIITNFTINNNRIINTKSNMTYNTWTMININSTIFTDRTITKPTILEIKTEALGIYFSAAFCFHAIGLCFLSGRCKH